VRNAGLQNRVGGARYCSVTRAPSFPLSLPPTLLLSHPPGLSLSLFQVVDIFAEYQRQSSDVLSSAPVELRDTGADGTFRLIHSMRLYRTEALKESPTYVNVYAT